MELEESKLQQRLITKEIDQSIEQVDLFHKELKQLQDKLDQRETKLKVTTAQLSEIQAELEIARGQLATAHAAIANLQQRIDWMETSKFWKVRGRWLKFRQLYTAPFRALLSLKALSPRLAVITIRAILFLQHYRCYWLAEIMLKAVNLMFEPTLLVSLAASQSGQFNSSHFFAEPVNYSNWIAEFEPSPRMLKRQKVNMAQFLYQPVLSVVLPVYKVPLPILRETLESVFRQTYPKWELCIAFADLSAPQTELYLKSLAEHNDRIKLSVMPANLGISGNSNEAASLASGDFIVLLDHDDTLSDFAFYEIVKRLNQQPDLDFIYSDKDCISENSAVRSRLLLKPQWSPEILYSVNYLTHLCVIRQELFVAIDGFRSETDGAQDWDLFFRVTEQTPRIARVQGILYHWRIIQGSTSLGIDSKPYALEAQLTTVQSHLERLSLPAKAAAHPECGFHIQWTIQAPTAIVLVDGDVAWSSLTQCLSSLCSTLDPLLHKVCVVLPQAIGRAYQHEKNELEKTFPLSITWVSVESDESKLTVFAETARQHSADVVTVVSGQVMRFQQGWIK